MPDDNDLSNEEARDALDSVEQMKRSGYRRAVKPRWMGVGLSLVVATGFALYSLEDPGNLPALLLVLGVVTFVSLGQRATGASGQTFPGTLRGNFALAVLITSLLVLFFGAIYVRRAYDLAWVPVISGLVAGLVLFLLSESERRHYLAKAADGKR